MPKSSKELREENGRVFTEMQGILDNAADEKRELNAEETKRWDSFDLEFEKRKSQIDRMEKTEQRQAELDASAGQKIEAGESNQEPGDNSKELKERRASIFTKYLVGGISSLNGEERSIMEGTHKDLSPELRALTTTVDATGGFLVPEVFSNKLEVALKSFGGLRQVCDVISTGTGADIPWPTTDDTTNEGELLAENTDASIQDTVYGSKTLKASLYSSKMIKVPRTLMQDSFFDMDQHLAEQLAMRIHRITNRHFTTGDGTTQPEGIVTASSLGFTAAAAAAISFDELIELEHSVDPAYRGNGSFQFHDSTLKEIKKLKDGNGQYIWNAGDVKSGHPSTILGYSYQVNQDMAPLASAARTVLFGDMKKYKIRDVLGVVVQRLNERYAEAFQVAFIGFSRHDGRLIDVGGAVKHLVQA